MQLFKNELNQLKQELVNKTKEYGKATKTFSKLCSELPSVPFWKKPFIPLLQERVKRKLERLKRKIPDLEEKIEHYEQEIVDLEQGIYTSVIRVLKQLAFIASLKGVEGTEYIEILKIIEHFTVLEKGGEEEPL